MKLSTTKNQILNAVILADRIAGKKESLPVLSCILIDAGKEIVLRATNLEAGIEINVGGSVEEKGTIAVPASILSQTVRSIGSEKVTLSGEEGNLLIESKGTKTLIKSVPHAEFPALPGASGKRGISLSREKFLRALQSVVYAASPSMIRPELGSVYVSVKNGGVTCVATDSFRLAEKKIPGSSKQEADMLIPLKHAGELAYILERAAAETVDIAAEDAQMAATIEGVRYISRVIDAQFPNYKDIVPKDAIAEATLLKNDLSEMLKKARVFAGAEQHVGFHVYPKKKIFSATARNQDVGEMSDSIDAALEGDDIDINFHIGYLAECLSSIESDSVTLSFAGQGRPLVVKGVSDPSFLYLVMPLNR